MNNTTSTVLSIIGSVIGIIGSLGWFVIAIFFWAGFYDGMIGYEGDDISSGALGVGAVVAIIQLIVTLTFFILSLVYSTKARVNTYPKKCGTWLVISGSIIILFNVLNFLSGVLIMIAGIVAFTTKVSKDGSENIIEAE